MSKKSAENKPSDIADVIGQFEEAMASVNWKILKYDLSKQRPITTSRTTMNIDKFCNLMGEELSQDAVKYSLVWSALHSPKDMERILFEYSKTKGLLRGAKVDVEIPPDMQGLTLNMDLSAKGKDDRFFLTHEDETVSKVSGEVFTMVHNLSQRDATSIARKVIPEYMPRGPVGVSEVDENNRKYTAFNTYQPPAWSKVNRKKIKKDLPILFRKLVKHLFPSPVEQAYFYAWLYESLFSRAFVFLVLCGPPGTGKNRLKLVLRALHGHQNTVDGKKSTLVERFNSQHSEATLAWYDELQYDMKMENTMKELQNDSIAIERKGVDATRGTRIFASIVISNNKLRDNYVAFDARKFAPLVITDKRLEESVSPQEIDLLTKKVEDPKSESFDPEFLAQIVEWLKENGASKKWPNLEYRGPMFWILAHTSMSQWQKRAVTILLDPKMRRDACGWDEKKKAFLWSSLQIRTLKKDEYRYTKFPDFTTVKAFFETFRDGQGRKSFITESLSGVNILGDFWVKPIFKNSEIITEASIAEQREKLNEKTKKEKFDL